MRAEKLYRSFHSEPVREAFRVAVKWPDRPIEVGLLRSVVYRSDKWGDGLHDYEHRIASKSTVIVDHKNRSLGSMVRSPGDFLLSLARPPARVARLGDAIELVVDRVDDKRARLSLDQGPALYDSPAFLTFDRAGWHYYVVAAKAGAIVIRSRTLRVTRRGLVG